MPAATKGLRVTVVDDDDLLCEVVTDALTETLGASVACLPAAGSGIDDVAAVDPHLIVIDVWMIDGEPAPGWELIKQARTHPTLRRVPVLIMTADPHGLMEYASEIQQIGRVQLLLKPFSLGALEAAVQALLSTPHAAPDLSALERIRSEAAAGS